MSQLRNITEQKRINRYKAQSSAYQQGEGEVKVKVKVTLWYPTLCDPMDYTVHGILQARILEWVAFTFFRGSSQPRDWSQVSHIAGRRFNLCIPREALKYKNPSANIKDFKGGKEARKEEEGGGGGRGGAKGVALQTSPATYTYPGVVGLFPGLAKGTLQVLFLYF